MADNPNEEEYQFADLDEGASMFGEQAPAAEEAPQESAVSTMDAGNLKRNALILIGVVVGVLILYKFLGAFFSSKPSTKTAQVPPLPAPTVVAQPKQQQPIVSKPVVTSTLGVSKSVQNRLNALENTTGNTQTEVATLNNRVTSLQSSVGEISTKLSQISDQMATLSAQIQQTQEQLARHIAKPKRRRARVYRKPRPSIRYYVQAIIPGRAWLISSKGTTLTVSEGSRIAGYGVVRIIDPHQGKVILSSGKKIGFSPNDS